MTNVWTVTYYSPSTPCTHGSYNLYSTKARAVKALEAELKEMYEDGASIGDYYTREKMLKLWPTSTLENGTIVYGRTGACYFTLKKMKVD